ncbi:MAG TPA: hypothetical protein VFA56_06255 [Gaiellaceae bacterium]|nr:hypothetical protein [Gaiellaceae bacterium]
MTRLLAVALATFALAPAAAAATTVTAPAFDGQGRLIQTPFAPAPTMHLTKERTYALFKAYPKVASWLDRYPAPSLVHEETFDSKTASWTVKIWSGHGALPGEIAEGKVDDASGVVTEAWTGPQVAWKMARGYSGAFGGTKINSPWLWGAFCLVFFVGLANFRRPLSMRNLDLLMLLSPTASLWFFNHGDVFTSVPLFYPALVWVVARGIYIGVTGRGSSARPLFPVWVLLGATIFLAGFRIGLNVDASNVIDVGYSGVIGAERIVHGEAPWGNFPVEDDRPACGPKDAAGEIRERVQTNGRCESANPQGDTYGPVAYEAYIPGYGIFGWSGKWDSLPAVHFTSIAFDLLCLLGLWLVGRRFGGAPLAAALGFAWTAYPFTQYASNSNTNDAIMPAFLIWGFWLASAPAARGAFAALSGWTKFASLVVAPLWLTYPGRRPSGRFAAGFAVATLAAFSVVLLEPNVLHELRIFWDRTIWWQQSRDAPWSLWDWGQYRAKGIPDLHVVQRVLQGLLLAGALAAAVVPVRKSPLQLAALTAALLAGFQCVLTYWLYTYIPWFFAFAAIALLAPRLERHAEELDPERAALVGAVDDDALEPHPALSGLEANG